MEHHQAPTIRYRRSAIDYQCLHQLGWAFDPNTVIHTGLVVLHSFLMGQVDPCMAKGRELALLPIDFLLLDNYSL